MKITNFTLNHVAAADVISGLFTPIHAIADAQAHAVLHSLLAPLKHPDQTQSYVDRRTALLTDSAWCRGALCQELSLHTKRMTSVVQGGLALTGAIPVLQDVLGLNAARRHVNDTPGDGDMLGMIDKLVDIWDGVAALSSKHIAGLSHDASQGGPIFGTSLADSFHLVSFCWKSLDSLSNKGALLRHASQIVRLLRFCLRDDACPLPQTALDHVRSIGDLFLPTIGDAARIMPQLVPAAPYLLPSDDTN